MFRCGMASSSANWWRTPAIAVALVFAAGTFIAVRSESALSTQIVGLGAETYVVMDQIVGISIPETLANSPEKVGEILRLATRGANLQTVSFSGVLPTPANIETLSKCPALKKLGIDVIRIDMYKQDGTISGFEDPPDLATLQGLELLELAGCDLDEGSAADICRLEKLRWLSISVCGVDEGFIEAIGHAKWLDYIQIIRCGAGEKEGAFLQERMPETGVHVFNGEDIIIESGES
jgi:hypothetical protein